MTSGTPCHTWHCSQTTVPSNQITCASSLENEQQMSKSHHCPRNSQVIVMLPPEPEAHTALKEEMGLGSHGAPRGAKKLWMEYPRKITSVHGENYFLNFS